MDINGRSRLVLKVVCPLLIIVLPIFLFILWRVPNPEGPEHASLGLVITLNLIAIISWVFALSYYFFTLRKK